METSPPPGVPSSCAPVPELAAFLRLVAENPALVAISSALKGSQLYLVGGIVRDTLLGLPNQDIDLACDLEPGTLKLKLENAGIRVIPTGIEHGTVTALVAQQPIEITTFRLAGQARVPNQPLKFSSTIEADLAGRDFTINAMAVGVYAGDFVDPFSGFKDLQSKVLRAVGQAEARLLEDPLRLLRVIRFGQAAGRKVANDLWQAAIKLAPELKRISAERIRVELERILLSEHAAQALRAMQECQVLELVLPEILPSIGFEQNEFHLYDVYEHTLAVIEQCPNDLLLRLTALFHDLGKPHTLSVDQEGRRHFYKHELVSADLCTSAMERLRFSHDLTKRVKRLVHYHMRPLECGPAAVRRPMRDLEADLDPWLVFKRADSLGCKTDAAQVSAQIEAFQELLQQERSRKVGSAFDELKVNGHDLMAAGIPEGPMIGLVLRRLLDLVLDDPDNNQAEKLLAFAKEFYAEHLKIKDR